MLGGDQNLPVIFYCKCVKQDNNEMMRFLHECYEQVDRWEGSKKTGCYLLIRNVESQGILTECTTPAISNTFDGFVVFQLGEGFILLHPSSCHILTLAEDSTRGSLILHQSQDCIWTCAPTILAIVSEAS